MDTLKVLAFATWLFSVTGWSIAFLALSTLQGWCNGASIEACSFFVGGGNDSQIFSYMWWILSAQFVVMLMYVALLPSRMMCRLKIAVVAMFTILSLKFMDFADQSLHAYWQLDKVDGTNGTLKARLQTFVAGCCLTFIGNVFIIFGTSVLDDEAPPAAAVPVPQFKGTEGSPV